MINSATSEDAVSSTPKFLAFSQRMSSELNIVSIDHCYAKPWSSHPDASNARPLHLLFMEKFPRSSETDTQKSPDIIDVEGEDDAMLPMYDIGKARAMMSECERHAALIRPDFPENRDDWEDHIAAIRTTWTVLQNRIFAKVMRVLQADRLARLSIQGTKNEPIQRRLQIDKAAKRVRFAFANIGLDMTLVLWLHNLFLDNLRGQLLTSYLEVLQTLKAKIPSLIERLIQGTTSSHGGMVPESLAALLKKSWDPVMSSINQQKLKRLPDNPLLLIISSAPSSAPNPVAIKRHKFWHTQLTAMGKVINVVPINNSTSITIANCVENMIATTRSKILEMKGHFPGRPIVLIGWHVGALVACHVSLMETVHGVVCLGFPTMGVNGIRGEVDDQLYNSKTPTLFVVGQHASSLSLDTLEDIREKLRVETGLVVVGGADDQLRMSRAKKRACGVTQAMVDRCIMDEMSEFLGNILSQVIVQPENIEDIEVTKKQRKRKQKDMSAMTGPQTSLPKQPNNKTVRAMKLANAGTVAYSGQLPAASGPKLAKKSSPKKRSAKQVDGSTPSKKPMLHLSFPMLASSTGDQTPTLSRVSEAAAIASAPELSSLLQSIKPTEQQRLLAAGMADVSFSKMNTNTSATSSSSSSSSSIATTTALTLSRFLANSGFFKSGALSKTSDQGTDDGNTLAKTSTDSTTSQTASDFSTSTDDLASKQQPQILIRTGASSTPFSIPLSFTMASRVLKSPVMRITGSSPNSPHIQQLLTSMAGTTHTTAMSSPVGQSPTKSPSPSLGVTSASTQHSASSILSSMGMASPVSGSNPKSPSLLGQITPGVSSASHSPGASIINIGSDTLFMKETPPSTASAPGTVSIDLGQIASTSNMKLSSGPKISLIPSMKQIPISGSTEKLLLTAPLTESQPSIATLSSLSQCQQMPVTRAQPLSSKTAQQVAASSHLTSILTTTTDSVRTLSALSAPPSMRAAASMSNSQLLSTLSSNSGLITLKLSAQSFGNISSSNDQGKDGPEGQVKDTDLLTGQARGSMNLQFTNLTYTPTTKSQHAASILSSPHKSVSDQLFCRQNVLTVSSPSKSSPTASLLLTQGTKLGTGQIVLQCRPSQATGPQAPSSKGSSSPHTQVGTGTETLGQVTSLLESSPITLGDKRKSTQADSSDSSTPSVKQHGKAVTQTTVSTNAAPSQSLSSASSSSSSLSSQGSGKASKSTLSSYSATTKPVLPTVASTRTRRIKTPKQYDL